MKFFSFKILILCILLPPVLYLGTVHGLERYLTRHYHDQVRNVYLSEMNDILNGTVTVRESIQRSIRQFISEKPLLRFGIQMDITVSTKDGIILYPPMYGMESPADSATESPIAVARQNFRLLSNGLTTDVEVTIRPYSAFAVSILFFYILIDGVWLYFYFRRISGKLRQADREKTAELDRLHRMEDELAQQISSLSIERQTLLNEYQGLEKALAEQKRNAAENEEEMFDEIGQMEQKLRDNLARQENQAQEILELEEKIGSLEKLRETIEKQKEKNVDKLSKRFKTLYKNIDVHERALLGLSELTDDMALKAEEVVHQLNADSSTVPIKRKVFSKKGKGTVFEVVFAYNGRLYFRKNGHGRVEVLSIGTKNTQAKDLAYLDRV